MPKTTNEQIGICECALCGEDAPVYKMRRSTKKVRLYYNCDQCGCIQPNKPAGQKHITNTFKPMENGRSLTEIMGSDPKLGGSGPPTDDPDPRPDPGDDDYAGPSIIIRSPKPAGGGLIDFLLGDDD